MDRDAWWVIVHGVTESVIYIHIHIMPTHTHTQSHIYTHIHTC